MIPVAGASHGATNPESGSPTSNVRHIRASRRVRLGLGCFIAGIRTGYAE